MIYYIVDVADIGQPWRRQTVHEAPITGHAKLSPKYHSSLNASAESTAGLQQPSAGTKEQNLSIKPATITQPSRTSQSSRQINLDAASLHSSAQKSSIPLSGKPSNAPLDSQHIASLDIPKIGARSLKMPATSARGCQNPTQLIMQNMNPVSSINAIPTHSLPATSERQMRISNLIERSHNALPPQSTSHQLPRMYDPGTYMPINSGSQGSPGPPTSTATGVPSPYSYQAYHGSPSENDPAFIPGMGSCLGTPTCSSANIIGQSQYANDRVSPIFDLPGTVYPPSPSQTWADMIINQSGSPDPQGSAHLNNSTADLMLDPMSQKPSGPMWSKPPNPIWNHRPSPTWNSQAEFGSPFVHSPMSRYPMMPNQLPPSPPMFDPTIYPPISQAAPIKPLYNVKQNLSTMQSLTFNILNPVPPYATHPCPPCLPTTTTQTNILPTFAQPSSLPVHSPNPPTGFAQPFAIPSGRPPNMPKSCGQSQQKGKRKPKITEKQRSKCIKILVGQQMTDAFIKSCKRSH